MTFYIYKITNLINLKIYIGKTKNIRVRWNSHKTATRAKRANDYSYLHRAMSKHGFDNFKVEEIDQFEDESEALAAEIKYIAEYDSMNREIGYNRTEGGDGVSGYKYSEEDKKKMSDRRKGKYIGENNWFYGKEHSDETKQLISEKHKNNYLNNPEKLDQFNISQCDFQLEQCLEIQLKYINDMLTMEHLAAIYNTNIRTIHSIIHGKYKAIKGHSIISKELFSQIKIERKILQNIASEKFAKATEELIIECYQGGFSIRDTAEEFNCSEPTINKVLRKHNIKISRYVSMRKLLTYSKGDPKN